jgi:hypothetical protein
VYSKVWHSRKVQDFLRSKGGKWIYDGRKLAWYVSSIGAFSHINLIYHFRSSMSLSNPRVVEVDLDEEEGQTTLTNQPPSTGRNANNKFVFKISRTKTLDMVFLQQYLAGKVGWDKTILESMSKEIWTRNRLNVLGADFDRLSGPGYAIRS